MAGPTKQIILNFEKMNKTALMPIARKFQRYGVEVAEIEATNKPKRESGYQVKTATFTLGTGQKLSVKVKSDGTVFQVKLNNKVLPVQHVDDMDKAIIEIVDFVQENEKSFKKAQERRIAKIAAGETKPSVRTTRAEQIENFTAKLEELQNERENLNQSANNSSAGLSRLREQLSEAQAELDELVATGTELENELESLKQAA